MQVTCLFCSDEFEATRNWMKFCSVKCRNNYHNDSKYRANGTIPSMKCPHCLNDEFKLFEELNKGYFLCNVCAREFYKREE